MTCHPHPHPHTHPYTRTSVPAWLNRSAKALWRKLAQELDAAGTLTEATAETLGLLCQSYGEYRDMTSLLETEGRVITTHTGAKKPHPAAALQKASAELFTRLAAELKLTPKSKAAVKATPDDELTEFLGA